MGKLLRSELKSIVKECLVEILAEGIGNNTTPSRIKEVKTNSRKKSTLKKRKTHLDNIKVKSKKNIQNTNLTNDPVLNELLADTAKTTLHEQVAADSKRRMSEISRPADAAALAVSKSEPEDLFGDEAAGKWAKLAFFDQ